VILAVSALVLQPPQQETGSIPIVFIQIGDPVGSGIVASLAHPGGNITGFTPAEARCRAKNWRCSRRSRPSYSRGGPSQSGTNPAGGDVACN